MRIDDINPTGTSAAQPGKTPESQEVERGTESRWIDSRWKSGADQVDLSDLAGRLSRVLNMSAAERASRVEKLTDQYAQGRYHVDSLAVSRAILAEIREAGRESSE
jgi:anti-sigma28 factor (negative regulator of flagellin synthesis)